jgi:hypothetical protein
MYGQDISLYHQYNGRYDFVFGNTLNRFENGTEDLVINTSSAASLSLNRDDEIQNAYLIGLDLALVILQ